MNTFTLNMVTHILNVKDSRVKEFLLNEGICKEELEKR